MCAATHILSSLFSPVPQPPQCNLKFFGLNKHKKYWNCQVVGGCLGEMQDGEEGELPSWGESFCFKSSREPLSWRWESWERNTVNLVVPLLTYLCMRVWVCMCMLWACVEFRGQPLGIGFLPRPDWTRIVRFGGKCPYSLSHFASPPPFALRGQRKRSHAHWPWVWKGKNRF